MPLPISLRHWDRSIGPRLLIEAYHPNLYGGTGKTADWQVAATLAQPPFRSVVGRQLDNGERGAAIQTVQPWGVDVSSGVEATPGRKDHEKVRAFVQAAKHRIK